MVGGLQTTNQLVGGLQTANQLVGGLQTTNQLVGGLQTTNHGAQIPPWWPFGDLVTQRQFLSKNSKMSRSIHQKTKR